MDINKIPRWWSIDLKPDANTIATSVTVVGASMALLTCKPLPLDNQFHRLEVSLASGALYCAVDGVVDKMQVVATGVSRGPIALGGYVSNGVEIDDLHIYDPL